MLSTEHVLFLYSISQPVFEMFESTFHGALTSPSFSRAKVLSVFQRSINLLISDRVVTLVTREFGNGPFHIQVSRLPEMSGVKTINFSLSKKGLVLGTCFFHGDPSQLLWNPYIFQEKIQYKISNIDKVKKWVDDEVTTRKLKGNCIGILSDEHKNEIFNFQKALTEDNKQEISKSVTKLAGRGPGLTPSGDDFLVGVILGLWLIKEYTHLIRLIYESSAPYTTYLSKEFLQSAAMGATDEIWHQLMKAMSSENSEQLKDAFDRAISWGATSGLDRLAGFVFITKNSEHLKRI